MKKKLYLMFITFTIILSSFYINNVCAETIYNSGIFNYTVANDIVTITGISSSNKDVTIPAEIDGMKVKYIGDEAFINSSIEKITIPEGIEEIYDRAFYNCRNLKELSLPVSLKSIGNESFGFCISLEEVHLYNINKIGEAAFISCSSMKVIYIEGSISLIPYRAFDSCTSLKGAEIPDTVLNIDNKAFINCTSLNYISLPHKLQSIGYYAFYNTDLVRLCVPYGTQVIGPYAFAENESLEEIVIPSTIHQMDISSFFNTPTTIRFGGSNFSWTNITEGIFTETLKNVSVYYECHLNFSEYEDIFIIDTEPTKTKEGTLLRYCCCGDKQIDTISCLTSSIWTYEHKNATCSTDGYDLYTSYYGKVKKIIPKTENHSWGNPDIESSDDSAEFFYTYTCSVCGEQKTECTLNFIHYMTSDNTVGIFGIENSDKIYGELVIPSEIDGYPVDSVNVLECPNVTSIKISEGIEEIYSFVGCTSLKEVTLPQSIKKIGMQAFYYSPIEYINFPDGIEEIGYEAFTGSKLKEITIPAGVDLTSYVFSGCRNLEKVTIEEGVTSIPGRAFGGCSSLTELNLPNSLTFISAQAFDGCKSLTGITIPENVTGIGQDAFSKTGIKNIIIPASVNEIYGNPFSYCGQLETITVNRNNSKYFNDEAGVLYDKQNNSLISFPEGSQLGKYTVYKGTENILKGSFCMCKNLKSVIFPESVKKIDSIFYGEIVYPGTGVSESSVLEEIYFRGNAPEFVSLGIPNSSTITAYYPYSNTTYEEAINTYSNINWVELSESGEIPEASTEPTVAPTNKPTDTPILTPGPTMPPVQTDSTITVASVKARPGEIVEIPVSISDNPGIAAFSLKMSYDNTILTPQSISIGNTVTGSLTSNIQQSDIDISNLNNVTAVWTSESNNTNNGILYTVSFKVSDDAEDGKNIPITLYYDEGDITNQNLDDVYLNVVNGSVTIQDIIFGDTNGDEKINSKDVVWLKQYLASWDIEFTERMASAADVYPDGKVNSKDVVRLQQYIAGWDVILGE